MKLYLTMGLTALIGSITPTIYAQDDHSKVMTKDSSRVSLFEYATKTPKRSKVFNLDLELHAGFNANFLAGKWDEASFQFKDIKIEATGEINDRLFYWYRQKLNGDFEGSTLENLNESIEYAYIGYKLNDRFTIIGGKQDVYFGGFEYDENPLLIYEYSDMNEYTSCYFTGLSLAYQPCPSQELRLQVTNSRMGSMEDEFGRLPNGIKKPGAPLLYTINWNGGFFDDALMLRYSFSTAEQYKGKFMYSIFTGQSLEIGPVYTYFDAMYARGPLDPLGVLTDCIQPSVTEDEELPMRAQNTDYLSLVAEIQYQFHPKWQLFAKGMYETASIYKAYDGFEKGKYRTAWGYQGGINFFPMADDNLRLYLLAAGRTYDLTERAKALDAFAEDNWRLSVGLIYRLPLY